LADGLESRRELDEVELAESVVEEEDEGEEEVDVREDRVAENEVEEESESTSDGSDLLSSAEGETMEGIWTATLGSNVCRDDKENEYADCKRDACE